jgi:uncharacterized membrane protein
MKTLFAITYPSVTEAQAALEKLRNEQKAETIAMVDAVIVTRGEDGSVKLDQMVNMTAMGAASGAIWGSLIGLIFLAPLAGAAVGATAGAISGYFTDYGISDNFMKELGAKTAGGGATLFVLAAQMTADRIADTLGSPAANVLYTSMPDDLEARFKGHFGKQPSLPASAMAG